MKDKIDHWAFKWSHRILEEVMVRPEYDVKQLLILLNEDQLAEVIPSSKIKGAILDGARMNLCVDAPKLNESLSNAKLGQKKYKGD